MPGAPIITPAPSPALIDTQLNYKFKISVANPTAWAYWKQSSKKTYNTTHLLVQVFFSNENLTVLDTDFKNQVSFSKAILIPFDSKPTGDLPVNTGADPTKNKTQFTVYLFNTGQPSDYSFKLTKDWFSTENPLEYTASTHVFIAFGLVVKLADPPDSAADKDDVSGDFFSGSYGSTFVQFSNKTMDNASASFSTSNNTKIAAKSGDYNSTAKFTGLIQYLAITEAYPRTTFAGKYTSLNTIYQNLIEEATFATQSSDAASSLSVTGAILYQLYFNSNEIGRRTCMTYTTPEKIFYVENAITTWGIPSGKTGLEVVFAPAFSIINTSENRILKQGFVDKLFEMCKKVVANPGGNLPEYTAAICGSTTRYSSAITTFTGRTFKATPPSPAAATDSVLKDYLENVVGISLDNIILAVTYPSDQSNAYVMQVVRNTSGTVQNATDSIYSPPASLASIKSVIYNKNVYDQTSTAAYENYINCCFVLRKAKDPTNTSGTNNVFDTKENNGLMLCPLVEFIMTTLAGNFNPLCVLPYRIGSAPFPLVARFYNKLNNTEKSETCLFYKSLNPNTNPREEVIEQPREGMYDTNYDKQILCGNNQKITNITTIGEPAYSHIQGLRVKCTDKNNTNLSKFYYATSPKNTTLKEDDSRWSLSSNDQDLSSSNTLPLYFDNNMLAKIGSVGFSGAANTTSNVGVYGKELIGLNVGMVTTAVNTAVPPLSRGQGQVINIGGIYKK